MNVSRERWGTYGQHFSIFNIMQRLNLMIKLYIVFEAGQKSLDFQLWQIFLKLMSVVFFVNLKLCP
jgi:hypothetical protein